MTIVEKDMRGSLPSICTNSSPEIIPARAAGPPSMGDSTTCKSQNSYSGGLNIKTLTSHDNFDESSTNLQREK
jgi:hypothetical protein